jgi:phosphoribosylformylglycinamidine cyclo-ligase
MLRGALELPDSPIKGLAHITGGGFLENIPRILPNHLNARIQSGSWPVPALFSFIEQRGEIEPNEMFRVFNQGIGMIAVVQAGRLKEFQAEIPEETWVIGEITDGQKEVVIL